MKLKTLEEITKPMCATEFGKPEGTCWCNGKRFRQGVCTGEFVRRVIKKEAIKWIKELEHVNSIEGDYGKFATEGRNWTDCEEVINFIKHFFNIKESDL